jgi:hypothetical protein
VIRAVILAHQGGWDEMLFVLVPVAAVIWLLRLANRRVKDQQVERDAPK